MQIFVLAVRVVPSAITNAPVVPTGSGTPALGLLVFHVSNVSSLQLFRSYYWSGGDWRNSGGVCCYSSSCCCYYYSLSSKKKTRLVFL